MIKVSARKQTPLQCLSSCILEEFSILKGKSRERSTDMFLEKAQLAISRTKTHTRPKLPANLQVQHAALG